MPVSSQLSCPDLAPPGHCSHWEFGAGLQLPLTFAKSSLFRAGDDDGGGDVEEVDLGFESARDRVCMFLLSVNILLACVFCVCRTKITNGRKHVIDDFVIIRFIFCKRSTKQALERNTSTRTALTLKVVVEASGSLGVCCLLFCCGVVSGGVGVIHFLFELICVSGE